MQSIWKRIANDITFYLHKYMIVNNLNNRLKNWSSMVVYDKQVFNSCIKIIDAMKIDKNN